MSSHATGSAAPATCTITPTTTPAATRSMPAASGNPIYCCRSSPRAMADLPHMLARKNVLAGLLFIAVALVGLWVSRDYQIGTALRMGTGYVPRLLCWTLLGLGTVVLLQGAWTKDTTAGASAGGQAAWRPVVFVTASLVVFGLTIERL